MRPSSFGKVFQIAAVAVIAPAVLLLPSCSKKEKVNPMMAMMMAAPSVRTVAAEVSSVPLTVSAVGTAEAIASVDVKSRVTGQVLRVRFEPGQEVRQGQVLFEIDPEPLQRQLAQIQADISKDEALEAQARANVDRDQAQLKQSQGAAQRGLALSKEGIFSKEQTEQVVATADSAQASLDAEKAAVDSAVASLKSDRARLAQTQLQLSYTNIVAPISGRAGAVDIKAGNLVQENNTTLVTLLQIAPIYVSFGLPEQMLGEVQGYQAKHPLVIHASPSDNATDATGKLVFIDNTVDPATGTINLKAQFANAKHVLWPGQFVNVQAQLKVEHDRVLVPSRTVQTGPQGKYVWLLDDKNQTVSMRPVTVLRNVRGGKSAEDAVIGDGLSKGDKVISEGQMRLAPGMKVKVLGGEPSGKGSEAAGEL